MTTTSLFSHSDLQRHIAEMEGDGALGFIGILVALAAETGVAEVMERDGVVSVVIDGGAVFKLQDVNLDVELQAAMLEAILPQLEQESLYDAASVLIAELGSADGTAESEAAISDAINDVATAITYSEYPPGFTGGVRVAAADVNGDGDDDMVVGFAMPDGEDGFQFTPAVGFTGDVRVQTGDVTGDGTVDAVVTILGGEQFVFADGSVVFSDRYDDSVPLTNVSAGGGIEVKGAAEGGGLWNFGDFTFEDVTGSEEIYFASDTAEGHDWFTATDDLWL